MKIDKDSIFSISVVCGLVGYAAAMTKNYSVAAGAFAVVGLGGVGISWHYLSEKGQKPESLFAITPSGIRRIRQRKDEHPTIEEITWGMATHMAFIPLAVLCFYKGVNSDRDK